MTREQYLKHIRRAVWYVNFKQTLPPPEKKWNNNDISFSKKKIAEIADVEVLLKLVGKKSNASPVVTCSTVFFVHLERCDENGNKYQRISDPHATDGSMWVAVALVYLQVHGVNTGQWKEDSGVDMDNIKSPHPNFTIHRLKRKRNVRVKNEVLPLPH